MKEATPPTLPSMSRTLFSNVYNIPSCKSWFYSVRQKLTSLDLHNYCNILCPIVKYSLVKAVYEKNDVFV